MLIEIIAATDVEIDCAILPIVVCRRMRDGRKGATGRARNIHFVENTAADPALGQRNTSSIIRNPRTMG